MSSFVTLCTSHLENIASLNYSDPPNADTLHNTIIKITFINITKKLIRNIFKYWKTVKVIVTDLSLPKFEFLLEKLSVFIGRIIVILIFV